MSWLISEKIAELAPMPDGERQDGDGGENRGLAHGAEGEPEILRKIRAELRDHGSRSHSRR